MALNDKDAWRSKYNFMFTQVWRAQKLPEVIVLNPTERLAHILSRFNHGNMEYQKCDHCSRMAAACFNELKEFFLGEGQ